MAINIGVSWYRNPFTGLLDGRYSPPAAGKTITITAAGGQNFGSGPDVVIFDQFIGADRAPAFRLPDFGEWDNITTYVAGVPELYYDSGTDRTWLSGRDPNNLGQDSWNMAGLFKYLGNVTKFRISHRAWVPVGKFFPAATSAGVFPAASSWKMLWLGKSNGARTDLIGSGAPDRNVCIPTHIGSGTITVGGNDNSPVWNDGTDHLFYGSFSFTAPTLYSYYQDGAGVQDEFNRTVEFLSVSDTGNSLTVKTNTDPMHESAAFNTRDYDGFRFPGWFGNASDWTDVTPLNSDIYVAVGDDCRAAIYVGNAATRVACTELYHCLPFDWTTGGIGTILADHNDFGSSTYFHIEKSDGTWIENVNFTRS
jgi:hypothetical protein